MDQCVKCKYNTGDFVCHPHCGGCDGLSRFVPLERTLTDRLVQLPTCRICGCTDANGCPEGCWWVEDDLCSRCARSCCFVLGDRAMSAALHMAGNGFCTRYAGYACDRQSRESCAACIFDWMQGRDVPGHLEGGTENGF